MNRYRCGKIISTVGMSSSNSGKLEELLLNGTDVFRLNFAYGTRNDHTEIYKTIRALGKKHELHPTILADIQGTKLRIGVFENDKIILESGDTFRFDLDDTPGNTRRVNLPHPEIFDVIRDGNMLLIDDGKLRFEVTYCGTDYIDTRVIVGGALYNRKSISIPNVKLNIPVLSRKDMKDLQFALDLGVDWITSSFIQTVDDVLSIQKIIEGRAGFISKIGKPVAIQALEPIVEASEAIIIDRGDLSVEVSPEEVPAIQRRIVNVCHRVGKPVIISTQMLESMISSPNPTRAEITDIANAVYCGVDATMLSAESASGMYPIEAVNIMRKTIETAESDPYCVHRIEDNSQTPHHTVIDAICAAAKTAAEYSSANAIVLFSDDFNTVLRCSRLHPRVPIILVTASPILADKVGICYGVRAIFEKIFEHKSVDVAMISRAAKDFVKSYKFAEEGDTIVVVNNLKGQSIDICQV